MQMRTKRGARGKTRHGVRQEDIFYGSTYDPTCTFVPAFAAARGGVRQDIQDRTRAKICSLGPFEFDSAPADATLAHPALSKKTPPMSNHDDKSERSLRAIISERLAKAPKSIDFLNKLVHYLIATRRDVIVSPGALSPETIAHVQSRIDVMADLTSLRDLLDTLLGRRVMG